MKRHIPFLLTGSVAGGICVAVGSSWLVLVNLSYGVGPAFFLAVVAGLALTGGWRKVKCDLLRYGAGLVICTFTYLLALFTFFTVAGFSPDVLGFRRSERLYDFGPDVVSGLTLAGGVAAGGVALFTAFSDSDLGQRTSFSPCAPCLCDYALDLHRQPRIPRLLVLHRPVISGGNGAFLLGCRIANL